MSRYTVSFDFEDYDLAAEFIAYMADGGGGYGFLDIDCMDPDDDAIDGVHFDYVRDGLGQWCSVRVNWIRKDSAVPS